MLPDPEIVKPLLMPILDLSNREFKERFGNSSAAWRGKKPMQRNAIIALGNFKEAGAVPKLTEIVLKEPRPEMRGTAAWALGRIGGEEALAAVESALEREEHDTVRQMLSRAQDVLLTAKQAREDNDVNEGKRS
jgi:epoxyqueuosine reductase